MEKIKYLPCLCSSKFLIDFLIQRICLSQLICESNAKNAQQRLRLFFQKIPYECGFVRDVAYKNQTKFI